MAFRLCPFCGPKCSICCSVMSVWGILFLGLLGVFFYVKSSILYEDIGYEPEKAKGEEWDLEEVEHKFWVVARNCWIAAAAYVVTLVISVWQVYLNMRQSGARSN